MSFKDWKEVKLGEICDIKGGKRLPKGSKLTTIRNNHPYIRVKDMSDNRLICLNDTMEYVEEDVYSKICKYIVNTDDIILSIVGTIGMVSMIDKSLNHANLTENCVKLVNLNGIDNKYLYYFLTSNIGQGEINKGIVGSTQPKLPIYSIQNIDIKLPPIGEQKAIAKILSDLDDKIEVNNKINKRLEEMAQSIFKQWFVDFEFPNKDGQPYKSSGGEMVDSELGMIPKEWEVGTFRNYIADILGGDWGKEQLQANYIKEVYCVRGADIPEINKGNKGKSPIRFILEKNYNNKKLNDGDLIVEISGGSPTQSTGRISYINKGVLEKFDKDLVCTNFCRAITLKDRELMEFIYSYWIYLYKLDVFFQFENGTTGIKNLDINNFLDKLNIINPPKEIISQFYKITNVLFETIQKNGKENEELSNLRDILLPKLMSGEIRVPLDK